MGRFLQENQQANQNNLTQIVNIFADRAKRQINPQGKTRHQVALEEIDRRTDEKIYNEMLLEMYRGLPEINKRILLNHMGQDVKNENINRAKVNLGAEIAEYSRLPQDHIFNGICNHIRNLDQEEREEWLRPLMNTRQFQEYHNNPTQERMEQFFQHAASDPERKLDFLHKYYRMIETASTLDKAKEYASIFLTPEKMSEMKFTEYETTPTHLHRNREMLSLIAAQTKSNEEIDQLITKYDNTVPIQNREWEDVGIHPLAGNTARMKDLIDNSDAVQPEEKEQVKAMMDRINNDIIVTDSSHIDAVNEYRDIEEKALANEHTSQGTIKLQSMGINPEITEPVFDEKTMTAFGNVVNEERRQDFERMRGMEMQYSDETKNAIKEVFNKFEQYGYAPQGIQQEQGTKAYALSAYHDAYGHYVEALGSGNVQDAVQYARELDQHKNNFDDILNTVHQHFPMGQEDTYPGNLDVTRNDHMPAEYRRDIKGVSFLNGLYGIYSYIKEKDLDVDEFLNAPLQHIEKFYTEDAYDANYAVELIKDRTGANAVYFLQENPVSNAQYGAYGVPRMVECLGCIETDPELKKQNSATEVAFTKSKFNLYHEMVTQRSRDIRANEGIVDRFLIVEEPQIDGRLLNSSIFDPSTGKLVESKGFDEAEYLANHPESAKDFYDRLKDDVVHYMSLNDTKGEADKTLSNTDFVKAAQSAAAKYLMVKGIGNALQKPEEERTDEEKAIANLVDFVNEGKPIVDNWIDQEYIHPTDPERPILEAKGHRLQNSYQTTNPYAHLAEQCDQRYRQQRNQPGSNTAYADVERTKNTIDEKKAYLTESFRNGRVPGMFYEARMKQLEKGEVNAQMPPFFAADDLGDVEDYISKNYDADTAATLSPEEKDYLYNKYINRAKADKHQFIAKQMMMEHNMVQRGQFFTSAEMEKMYTTANDEAHREEQERIEEEAREAQERRAAELEQPHEERIKLQRNGEELTARSFPWQFERFITYSYRERPEKEENETELSQVQRREIVDEDHLRAAAFVKKVNEMLTPAQRNRLGRFAPQEAQSEINNIVINRIRDMVFDEAYYNRREQIEAMPNGPAKTQAQADFNRKKNAVDSLRANMPYGQIIDIMRPFLTEEQLNSPRIQPGTRLTGNFFTKCPEYAGKELARMLTTDQLQELNNLVTNYKVPWNRTHEEMGQKVFTDATEIAKNQIDQLETVNGRVLTVEEKNEMKGYMDAANDYLREPIGEDPNSAYFALNTAYEKAALHDGQQRGNEKVLEEGLDPNTYDEVVELTGGTVDIVNRADKQEEIQKWNEQEFKMSPQTKEACLHVFNKMQQFGYGGQGVIGEQGSSKEYGLGKLADAIRGYKSAMGEGDPVKIAEASKTLMAEKAHVDELLGYIKEHFPVDRHNANFAKPGNVDVVRNGLFPPELRYDDAAVSTLNGLYAVMNFAEACGVSPQEFIEHPSRYMRQHYLDDNNPGINNALRGKTGGEAFFEANKNWDKVPAVGYGSGRAFETLYYIDQDPAIRAHNHGLAQYLEKTVSENAPGDRARRAVAYKDGHLDRLLFVTEPRDNASLLGVPIYNSKTLSYDKPEEFNELDYLRNNGKSVAEMKEILDKNIKDYLTLDATTKVGLGTKVSALSQAKFLEFSQKAAMKILMAKHSEKGTPAYEQLKGLLNNGHEYINGLIQPEKDKVAAHERRLASAKEGLAAVDKMIDDRLQTLADQHQAANLDQDEELKMLVDIKNQRNLEIEQSTAYINANGKYKEVEVNLREASIFPATEEVDRLEARINEYSNTNRRPTTIDFTPDDNFNRDITTAKQELATIETRFRARIRAVLDPNGNQPGLDAQIEEIANNPLIGPVAVDDEILVLQKMKQDKLAEIDQKKADYIDQLGRDVEAGRIPLEFKDARTLQLLDPNYNYSTLPPLFPKAEVMSKHDYLNSVAVNVDIGNYTDAERQELYEIYLKQMDEPRQRRIEEFALQKNAENLGFVNTKNEAPAPAPQVEQPQVQQEQPQVQQEQPRDFSGKWFEPGTQITKEAYIQKLKDTEAHAGLMDEHPVGNNWQERRQSIEEAKKDRARMEFFFRESWDKLSPEGKQNVYNALGAEGKRGLDYDIKTDYANILNKAEKSNESKAMAANIRQNRNNFTLEQVKQMAEPYMTEAERNDPRLVPINKLSYNLHIAEKGQHNVWEAVVNSLPEEEFKNIAYRTDAYKPILERPDEEVTVKIFVDEMNAAKGVIGAMNYYHGQPLTEERKNQINANIDQAGALIANLDPSYVSELESVRTGREEGNFGMNVYRKEQAVEEFAENGIQVADTIGQGNLKFTGAIKAPPYYIDQYNEKRNLDQINPDMLDQYNAMRNMKIQLRDETKQSVKAIFEKFDEFGYDQHEFAPEEGTKIYGFHGIAYAYNDLIDKLGSNDPVEKMKVGDASERLIGEYNKSKELMQMISDAGLDKGYYSSNLDIVRTQGLPIEFRKNVAGASALNGLYLIYHSLKQQNISYDDFLADPRSVLDRQTKTAIDNLDPNKAVRGKSAGEALFELSLPTDTKPERLLNSLLTRTSENITKIETDPNMAKHNAAVDQAFVMTNNFELGTMSHRDFVFSGGEPYFDRLLMLKEPLEDVSVLEVPTYNYDTMQLMPSREFDDMEYLMSTNEDPKTYAQRVIREGGRAIALAQSNNESRLTAIQATHAMQKAALKYLVAHPELDKNSREYRALNGLVNNPKQILRENYEYVNNHGGYEYKGQHIQINVNRLISDLDDEKLVERSYEDFLKSREVRNFGSATRTADEQANRNFKDLKTAVDRAQTAFDRATNDVQRSQALQQLNEANAALNAAVAQRKTQLMQDFKAGRITEEYLNRRNAQLDGRRFNESVPTMFEADKLMSKNEYINSKFADSRNELSNEEKTILYNRYIERCKDKKNAFLGNLYLKDQGITTRLVKNEHDEYVNDRKILTTAEKQQLAQRIDNIKQGVIPAQGGAQPNVEQPQVQNNQPQQQININPQPQVQNQNIINDNQNIINNNNKNPHINLNEQIMNNNGKIVIDLDEFDENEIDNVIRESIRNENNLEDKKVEDKKIDDGEKIYIDLDDEEDIKINNDILDIGQNKELNKDDLKK